MPENCKYDLFLCLFLFVCVCVCVFFFFALFCFVFRDTSSISTASLVPLLKVLSKIVCSYCWTCTKRVINWISFWFTKSYSYHNEENQQTMTKMYTVEKVVRIHHHVKLQAIPPMHSEENYQRPQIWPVSQSQNDAKKGKSTDHDQNLISSEGGQDTSACQSSGQSSLAFSRKCPEVANLACFTKSALYQLWSGQDTSACQISGHSKWLQ